MGLYPLGLGPCDRTTRDRRSVANGRVRAVRYVRGAMPTHAALELPDRPSVAVLPFTDASDDPDAQTYADGVTEHLTYTLACTPGLFVSGRNSAFTFKKRSVPPSEVGRALGVAHVLEGTIERGDDRVRLHARLSAADGTGPLWSRPFEGDAAAIFDIHTEIVERTIAAIAPGLRVDRSGIERTRFPADAGVYAKFLSAYSDYTAGSEESIRSLARSLDMIAALMPEQPLPLALKAQCYSYLVVQGWSTDLAADAAEGVRVAREALAMPRARESPAVLMMTGHTLAFFGSGPDEALGLLERSLSLNPNSAATYERSGWAHCFTGHADTAAAHFRAAKRQSPLDVTTFRFDSGLGLALCMGGEHAEAVAWLERAIRENPAWTTSYRVLAASLAHLGRQEEAEAAARALLAFEPGYRIGVAMRLYRPSPGRDAFVEGMRRAGLPD